MPQETYDPMVSIMIYTIGLIPILWLLLTAGINWITGVLFAIAVLFALMQCYVAVTNYQSYKSIVKEL